MFRHLLTLMAAATMLLVYGPANVKACSICPSVSPTICDEIDSADVAVLARFAEAPQYDKAKDRALARLSTFRIERVLKGKDLLGSDRVIHVWFPSHRKATKGDVFLVQSNSGGRGIKWSAPNPLGSGGLEYINTMLELPQDGTERLVYALKFLDDEDQMLRKDAFDELSKAPFPTLRELKPHLDPEQLIERIRNSATSLRMNQLNFTLLCVCGRNADLPFVERMVRNPPPKLKGGLAAVISCYLSLAGEDGFALVEEKLFSGDGQDDVAMTGAAIAALRFHGQESNVIQRSSVISLMHRLMAHPKLAGRVLSDLSRWEDWSVLSQVAELFRSPESDPWTRQQAALYTIACPLPEARQLLTQFQKVDPKAYQAAQRLAMSTGVKDVPPAGGNERPVNSENDPQQKDATSDISADLPITSEPIEAESAADAWIWVIGMPVAVLIVFMVIFMVGPKRREQI